MTIPRQISHETVLRVFPKEAEERLMDRAHVVGAVEHARRRVVRYFVEQVDLKLDTKALLEDEIQGRGVEKVRLRVREQWREYGNRGNRAEE